MQNDTFVMYDHEGIDIFVYRWMPDEDVPLRGIVQIAHGMCETALRYKGLAEQLTAHGYGVYANDHIGHGRTAKDANALGNPGPDAFNRMAHNMIELGQVAAKEHPGQELFLLGHSMGSFLTQKVMYARHESYKGFILSGTNGKRSLVRLGEQLALMQGKLQGANHRSMLLNAIVFGGFNRSFRPVRTAFDWLSRDSAEVDSFINDPLCGAICTTDFFQSFFHLLQEIHLPENTRRIDRTKPVYIFGGQRDPVGLFGKGIMNLVNMYTALGMEQVDYKLYPEGRHEMLHEINRNEVYHDILHWLEHHGSAQYALPARADDSETGISM